MLFAACGLLRVVCRMLLLFDDCCYVFLLLYALGCLLISLCVWLAVVRCLLSVVCCSCGCLFVMVFCCLLLVVVLFSVVVRCECWLLVARCLTFAVRCFLRFVKLVLFFL